jgi:hypothetical protein
MGMGYAANYADVIQDKDLENLCPKEYKAFMDILKTKDISMEEIAFQINYQEIEENKDVEECYERLCKAFNEVTELELALGFHCEDDGDRYDDIRGPYWSVFGVYDLTPAGKKYFNIIKRAFFVTFG